MVSRIYWGQAGSNSNYFRRHIYFIGLPHPGELQEIEKHVEGLVADITLMFSFKLKCGKSISNRLGGEGEAKSKP